MKGFAMKSSPAYKCSECDEVYQRKFDLMEHQNIHSNETPFMCISCRQSFRLVVDYVDHIRSKHLQGTGAAECQFRENPESCSCAGCKVKKQEISHDPDKCVNVTGFGENESHPCSNCPKVFESFDELNSHLNVCTGNKLENLRLTCSCCACQIQLKKFELPKKDTGNLKCSNCNKKFSSSEKLAKHACFISSSGESFKCSCLQSFTKASAFKCHIGSKPYRCCSCSMQFNTITNLVRHIRTHTKQKPYVCKDCGRGFSQSANLRNHLSVHLGVRAIKCNECNFSCKTYNGLLKHKKKHREGFLDHQNYVDGRKNCISKSTCPICNKQFLFKRNMGMHMKIHNNKASLCTECGKVFDSRSKLTSHYKACHREPSVCKTCGKVFASAVLLGAHEKIHVNVKLFSCNVCQKTFAIKNYLVQHMKTHSNRKQFSCSKCGKLFKVAVSLKYHSNICTSLNIPV